MVRKLLIALVAPLTLMMAAPSGAQSPTVRDLLERVGALEEKVTTLQEQVAALQSGASGSKTYVVPLREVLSLTTLLEVPGKIRLQGVCLPTASSLHPFLHVRGGSGDAPMWFNEVGTVISGATEGLLAPGFAQGFMILNPNPMNGVLLVQGHVALPGSSEVATFSVGGARSENGCAFTVKVAVTQVN